MNFTWNDAKRQANLKKHGLDFAETSPVFAGHTLTRPDTRFSYGEARFSAVGLLGAKVVLRTPRPKAQSTSFRCEKRNAMNENTTSPVCDDLDEAPVWSSDDFEQAVHRVGLQSVPTKKQKINITLDPDVVAWFKQQAGARGYQTLINAALREAMQKKTIEEILRRVIREELHSA